MISVFGILKIYKKTRNYITSDSVAICNELLGDGVCGSFVLVEKYREVSKV